jgi:RNA polymerase sigma-70 factor (sigma-E family)
VIAPKDDEFTDFVAAHGAQLLRTACLVTGDSHLGEDLVQTALAKAYGSWAKVQQADHPVAYVRRLMINTHLSWVRRLTNTERPYERFPDTGTGTGDHQTAHAETDEMRQALLRLSPRVRTAVVLRYFEDLTEAETAQHMGCSAALSTTTSREA